MGSTPTVLKGAGWLIGLGGTKPSEASSVVDTNGMCPHGHEATRKQARLPCPGA